MSDSPSRAFLDGMEAVARADAILAGVRRVVVEESVEAIRLASLERRAAAGDQEAKDELRTMGNGLDELVARMREAAA